MAKVLVIDDHDAVREGMAVALSKMGHEPLAFRSPLEGVSAFARTGADLVITDLKMEQLDGLSVVKAIRERDDQAVVMVVTAYGTVETAVSAMQLGAWDFLTKPFTPEILKAKVEKGLELALARRSATRLAAHNEVLSQDAAAALGNLVGESEPMQRLLSQVRRVAASEATVLVRGESGTGKELVARMIHQLSPRKDGPFISVHCAALAETLLESELFGHERGAFTGAVRRKLGRFELADKGTLFLDEVGEIPQSVQTKLLRVLQEKEIQRVGGEQTLKVDVRVVSATHRDLSAEVASGRFREDLYYRLHIVPLSIPPLRERPGDVFRLVEHFIRKHGPKVNRQVKGVTPKAAAALAGHRWPGNVRELENAVEQALVFSEREVLDLSDFPAFLGAPAATPADLALPLLSGDRPLPEILDALEKQLVESAYLRAGKVKTETARLLGIKTSALYYKLEKFGLIPKGERESSEP